MLFVVFVSFSSVNSCELVISRRFICSLIQTWFGQRNPREKLVFIRFLFLILVVLVFSVRMVILENAKSVLCSTHIHASYAALNSHKNERTNANIIPARSEMKFHHMRELIPRTRLLLLEKVDCKRHRIDVYLHSPNRFIAFICSTFVSTLFNKIAHSTLCRY